MLVYNSPQKENIIRQQENDVIIFLSVKRYVVLSVVIDRLYLSLL